MPDNSSERSSKTWVWLVAGLVALALGGAGFYWMMIAGQTDASTAEGPQPPLVRTAQVEPLDVVEIRQTGFVQPRFAVDVAPDVSGRIVTLHDGFQLGAQVVEGTPLISLRRTRFEADVRQAEAAVEQGRAAVSSAEASFNRQSELADQDFASQARLDEASVAREQADAQLALALANLRQAELALADTVVTAPYDALVIAENASVGQIIQAGTAVGRLVASEAVEVSVGLTPSDVALIGDLEALRGTSVDVLSTDGMGALIATGQVTTLDPQISEGTRTVNVVVEVADPFDGEGRTLRLDELVEVVIARPVQTATGSVPGAAIKAGNRLWEVTEAGALKPHDVRVLNRDGDRATIVATDLTTGARVLVSDLPAPFEGQTVRIEGQQTSGEGLN